MNSITIDDLTAVDNEIFSLKNEKKKIDDSKKKKNLKSILYAPIIGLWNYIIFKNFPGIITMSSVSPLIKCGALLVCGGIVVADAIFVGDIAIENIKSNKRKNKIKKNLAKLKKKKHEYEKELQKNKIKSIANSRQENMSVSKSQRSNYSRGLETQYTYDYQSGPTLIKRR